MPTTRERALDAALALVGDEGVRALTHTRVDVRAELPKGSTSNWFRTRQALLAGVITHLAERERADFAGAEATAIHTPDQLVDALTGMVEIQTGPLAARTRARYALFLESAHDQHMLTPLLTQRREYAEWTASLLAQIGAAHPAEAARTLMAAADGLVLHRVSVDPEAEIRPIIRRAVGACLT